MPQATGRYRRWLWAAGLGIPAALALGWLALPIDRDPNDTGVIAVAADAPPPAVPAPQASAAPPLTPARNAAAAVQNDYLVAREARDRAWADRSEATLLRFLRGLAEVDGRGLAVKCTTSVCAVSGLALEDTASGTMAPAWDALEHDTAGDTLRSEGLERAATTFGTGRVREAFLVYYRRADAPAK
jgi:hypothetical protein